MQNILQKVNKRNIQLELAKRDFYYYCKLKAPDFYTDDYPYLCELCDDLQLFIEDDNEILIINIGPRHGKSRTAALFIQWLLGNNPTYKIINASYSQNLSYEASKSIRDEISEQNMDGTSITFQDVFPGINIKRGSSSVGKWQLNCSKTPNYLATSPDGTLTGFGGNFILIDDIVKNAYEAYNTDILEKHFEWFCNTLYSRLEGKRKIILIMTRWNTMDLTGRLIQKFKDEKRKYKLVSKKTFDGKKMLNDKQLNYVQYLNVIKTLGEQIAKANYDQEPFDEKGQLYKYHNLYNPDDDIIIEHIRSKTDTADEGTDYLCNVIYGVTKSKKVYILDIYYTQEPMEITEIQLAQRLIQYQCEFASIESNNGGRGFARAVQKELKKQGSDIGVRWYSQNKNKKARIISNSASVMRNVYFPENWDKLWPQAYKDFINYQRDSKNKHDDFPDVLTAIIEDLESGKFEGA